MRLCGHVTSKVYGRVWFQLRTVPRLREREYECWLYRESHARFLLGIVRLNEAGDDACLTYHPALGIGETTASSDPDDATMERLVEHAIDYWRELAADRFARAA